MTHVAVAANISCLLALVNKLTAALKRSVKSRISRIFIVPWPETVKRTAEGPTKRPTVVMVRISRTSMSTRYLLIRCTYGSLLLRTCSLEVKSRLIDVSKSRKVLDLCRAELYLSYFLRHAPL